MPDITIEGVVLARNEESNIVDCLQSLRPHVDHLTLIDMESTDKTTERARPLVDRILSHPLVANFDVARNLANQHSEADWIFFLDADERVPERTGQLVRETLRARGHEFVAIYIPFLTQFCGKWIEHSGWWPGYTMPRVLKRGQFQFRDRIHGGVQISGPDIHLPADPELAIRHYSYRSIEHYVEKFNRYTTTESRNLVQSGIRTDWEQATRAMVQDWWLYYERNQGLKDGFHGWVLAWLAGQYRWFSHVKQLDVPELRAQIAGLPVPESMDDVLKVIRHELGRLRSMSTTEPYGVWFSSPLFDPSGYADDSRVFLKALAHLDRPLTVQEHRWSDKRCELPPVDMTLYRALASAQPQTPSIKITCCIPTLVHPDSSANINILRTIFETDRIPEYWLPHLIGYDEIWVWCEFNRQTFIRGGVAPERLRVVPGWIDTNLFRHYGPTLQLPAELQGRFVFLSIFDWQERKGWDVLLDAYCQEFQPGDGVGLLLKVTRANQIPFETVRSQADARLRLHGQSLAERPDIVIWDVVFAQADLASFYRSANAFVLASRGEGWGRPYMEAMASGLPTIGTTGSGNDQFMSQDNSLLVATHSAPLSEAAAREIPPYEGHHWREPDLGDLRRQMRRVIAEPEHAKAVSERASADMHTNYSIDAGARFLHSVLAQVEADHRPRPLPDIEPSQTRVVLEGELFAGHSFANVNEQLVRHLGAEASIGLSVSRVFNTPLEPTPASLTKTVLPYVDRALPGDTQVTIRHVYPPRWHRPVGGKWVHIQPWEFGFLPLSWIERLRNHVDEIWLPSEYAKQVYVDSGIPAEKIEVIPWGVDAVVYSPNAIPRYVPTTKTFRFLFVGGSILRKGIDTLLAAFLAEFTADEDVALIIKDQGTETFYRYGNFRTQIEAAIATQPRPDLLYLRENMTDGQRASLYAACHCLVAPYRGEGFGLPVLEAMAAGLPVIVPRGGATDDFVTEERGFLLKSDRVEVEHEERMVGPAWELQIDPAELRSAMRQAFANREDTKTRGIAARKHAETLTWAATAARMSERIATLIAKEPAKPAEFPTPKAEPVSIDSPIAERLDCTACVVTKDNVRFTAETLARIRPYVRECLVLDLGTAPRTADIAREYDCRYYPMAFAGDYSAVWNFGCRRATTPWILRLQCGEWLDLDEIEQLSGLLDSATPEQVGMALQIRPDSERAHPAIRLVRNHSLVQFRNRLADDLHDGVQALQGSVLVSQLAIKTLQCEPLVSDDERLALLHADLAERPQDLRLRLAMGRHHFEQGNFFHAECYLTDCLAVDKEPQGMRHQAIELLIEAYRKIDDPYRAAEWTARLESEHP